MLCKAFAAEKAFNGVLGELQTICIIYFLLWLGGLSYVISLSYVVRNPLWLTSTLNASHGGLPAEVPEVAWKLLILKGKSQQSAASFKSTVGSFLKNTLEQRTDFV